MPGVGLGNVEIDPCMKLAEGRRRLGPAGHDLIRARAASQVSRGRRISIAWVSTGPRAGLEDHDLEAAGGQLIGEGHHLGALSQGNFPHAGAGRGTPPCFRIMSAVASAIRDSKIATRSPARGLDSDGVDMDRRSGMYTRRWVMPSASGSSRTSDAPCRHRPSHESHGRNRRPVPRSDSIRSRKSSNLRAILFA